jgi:hypothetical protein
MWDTISERVSYAHEDPELAPVVAARNLYRPVEPVFR